MAQYFLGFPGRAQEVTFKEILGLVKGRSIVSLSYWAPEILELHLSGSAALRITLADNAIVVNVFSIANPDEPHAIPLPFGQMPQRVEARILERKVRGLRTAYSMCYLLETGRAAALGAYLVRYPYGSDIESALLESDERLYVESVSYGSWVLTAWLKTKAGMQALGQALAMIYARGREAWLQTLENKARLTGAEADLKEVAAERARFELDRDRLEYGASLINRLEDPVARDRGQRLLRKQLRQVMLGDIGEVEGRKRIPLTLPGDAAGEDADEDR